MTRGRPLILSASRRTDLPGFHPDACAERIRQRVQRLRTRYLYGVVFWTRHTRPFLPGGPLNRLITSEIENPVVNLTITGLGAGPLEPGGPSTEAVLSDLPGLVEAFHGQPWRIRWRFDPLLMGHSKSADFKRIAEKMASLAINTCTFSFPAYRGLKGDLTPQFDRAAIPRWNETAKADFLAELMEIATERGISLLSCSQPENLRFGAAIKHAQCIPKDVLEQGHPQSIPLDLQGDRSQRTHCRCVESEDIGDYELDRCLGGCVYCYSKAGGPL
jgi:hypothetical protein